MHILGISCHYHDAAAALLRDGQLVAAAQEERFSRIKHDAAFPRQAIAFCLEKAGLSPRDLDYAVFYEKPFQKLERVMSTCIAEFPHSRRAFEAATLSWLDEKLWIRQTIHRHLSLPRDRVLFCRHHESHAASAFFCSPFDDAAILTVDGVGEWTTATLGAGRNHSINTVAEMRFPHSLGLLYSTFTAFLGFEVNEGEYKVMGMAGYGQSKYLDEIYRIVRPGPDGSLELDMDYFAFQRSPDAMFSSKFVTLFGPPRDSGQVFVPGDASSQRYADIAASIQSVTSEVLVRMARHARTATRLDRLCLAGGVALNCSANAEVLRSTGFKDIYIQPAAGDAGGALGAALYAWHVIFGRPRGFIMDHSAWGRAYLNEEIEDELRHAGVRYTRFRNEDELLDSVVDRLLRGFVIGWFQGAFEWGPRALGQRSILADPRNAAMKDTVNRTIKHRELFRPFAPSVTAPDAECYFALPAAAARSAARFMLYALPVHKHRRESIPAVVHTDGTARVQVVESAANPKYYRLIQTFGQATGIPVLLNTSLNVRGEPIINSPAEALTMCRNTAMDALVLGDYVIDRPDLAS